MAVRITKGGLQSFDPLQAFRKSKRKKRKPELPTPTPTKRKPEPTPTPQPVVVAGKGTMTQEQAAALPDVTARQTDLTESEQLEVATSRRKRDLGVEEAPAGVTSVGDIIGEGEAETEKKLAGFEGERLSQQFGEAGVFEEPVIEPLITPEMENAGVLVDMAKSLIPDILKPMLGIEGIAIKDSKEMREAEARLTETELAVQNQLIDKSLKTGIEKSVDNEIDFVVAEMGLGIGTIAAAGGAAVLGGFVGSAAQMVGTDKKVKNLATGVVKLETVAMDVATMVEEGSMSVEAGFARLEYIDSVIDNLEAHLKLAAIESANVRISLKGEDVSIKIFSARSKSNRSKRDIAQFAVQGVLSPSEAHKKAAVLADLQGRYGSQ